MSPGKRKQELEAEIEALKSKEKTWGGLAGRSYSYYNGVGLAGVGIATVLSLLVGDLSLPIVQTMREFTHGILGMGTSAESTFFFLARLVFLYASIVAAVATVKNWDMVKSFRDTFRKKTFTKQDIENDKVSASTFGINAKNAALQRQKWHKDLKKESKRLEGTVSEVKMIDVLQKMQHFYNLAVAINQVSKNQHSQLMNDFNKMIAQYAQTLSNNLHLSKKLRNSFAQFENEVFTEETRSMSYEQRKFQNKYIEEKTVSLPDGYDHLAVAESAIHEMERLGMLIMTQDYGFNHRAYSLFVSYHYKATDALNQFNKETKGYEMDAINYWRNRIKQLCLDMRENQKQHPQIPQQDKELLKNLLEQYSY